MQFHVLSFEGPDPYAQVGGLGTRVVGLTEALAELGHEVHLWFVGDPSRPGHERRNGVELHRWCQWISSHAPRDVYDAEHAKAADYARSLPPFLMQRMLLPHLLQDGRAVVLAEEWQTANAVLHLDALLQQTQLRERVTLAWNANNVFGFDAIDWPKLRRAATITTVSRYMQACMRHWGVSAAVVPNGLPDHAYLPPDRGAVQRLRRGLGDRLVLTKLARWDPDKSWLPALGVAAALKRQGQRPLLIARGGSESYGEHVLSAARHKGLKIAERTAAEGSGTRGLLTALENVEDADMVHLRSFVGPDARRVLLRASDLVLANSRHEPFGLVGLETMAAGGLVAIGCTGEDYAEPGDNALRVRSTRPSELIAQLAALREDPKRAERMRRRARATSRRYRWRDVLESQLLPHLCHGESPSTSPE